MITLDSRTGSKELLRLFPPGIATIGHLEFGDAMFVGNGPEGDCLVGVERKTVGDLVNCISNGRLSGHQLIGLRNSYHVVYVVVEGSYRPNPRDGLLEVWRHRQWQPLSLGKRRFMARDVWAFLETLRMVCGVQVWHTANDDETVQWIRALHYWWTHKDYADHRGHLQPHTQNIVDLAKHTLVRRVAAQLRGIGWEKAKAVDKAFGSVAEMVAATQKQWEAIPGIGKGLSKNAMEELRGGTSRE